MSARLSASREGWLIAKQSLWCLSDKEEQPSIQKLVGSVAQDALVYLNEESAHTDAFTEDISNVLHALEELKPEFSSSMVDQAVLQTATVKSETRIALKNQRYAQTVRVLFRHSHELFS